MPADYNWLIKAGKNTRFSNHKISRKCDYCHLLYTRIPSKIGKYCGYNCSNKALAEVRDYPIGNSSPNWRGGITSITRARTNKSDWRQRAKQIRHRDNNKCKVCLSSKHLSVHHMIPWNWTQNDNPGNLMTVCQSCHTTLDYNMRGFYS